MSKKGVVMAKEMTAVEVAAWLASKGMAIPEDLQTKVANTVSDRAEEEITKHLSATDEKDRVMAAELWRGEIFELAGTFAEAFKGQEKNVGQGRVFERYVEVELPDGSKFMLRHREPREKK